MQRVRIHSEIDTLGYGEVAKKLGVHPQTVRRWVAEGNFPRPVPLGPHVRKFRIVDIEDWMREREGA